LNIIFISGVLAAGLEQLVRGRLANNEFWARFLRAYALDQQEPLTRHSACLASTPSAHFQMTGFINTDLYELSALGSIMTDATLRYRAAHKELEGCQLEDLRNKLLGDRFREVR
jgi:hypothetical protein